MTKGVWQRVGDLLRPYSEEADEQLRAFKQGATGVGDFHAARSPIQLKTYWKFCTVVGAAIDRTKDSIDDELRREILPPSETYFDSTGRFQVITQSIKLESMPPAEFNRFMDMAINYMSVMIETGPAELRQHFYDLCDPEMRRMFRYGANR